MDLLKFIGIHEIPVTSRKCHFKLPIDYQSKRTTICEQLSQDLELVNTIDASNISMYSRLFTPHDKISAMTACMHTSYSYDKTYIEDTITLLKQLKLPKSILDNRDDVYDNISKIIDNAYFKNEFQYFNLPYGFFDNLNHSSLCLEALTLYNMTTPFFTLIFPVVMLFIPFIILKFRGIELTFSSYINILMTIFKNSTLGKAIFSISEANVGQRIYLLVTIGFYFIQMYQNIVSCINFHKSVRCIHNELFQLKEFTNTTISIMQLFIKNTKNLNSYRSFNVDVSKRIKILKSLIDDLNEVQDYRFILEPSKIATIGYVMKCYYHIYDHPQYTECLQYSFYFMGYMSNIYQIQDKLSSGKLGFANICDDISENSNECINEKTNKKKCNKLNENEPHFKEAYYLPHVDSCVTNTYNIKNSVITGPNASGKTTHIKTIMLNVILSQQFGCGCYSEYKMILFEKLHCYMNVPDTSSRDSLFQAEARRCKNILSEISKDTTTRHLCIFDELYSGTNPYEAVASATSFLKYISNFKVTFFLTTHYVDICKHMESCATNYQMNVEIDDQQNISYKYKITDGISKIRGGTKVLVDLEYPEIIVESARSLL